MASPSDCAERVEQLPDKELLTAFFDTPKDRLIRENRRVLAIERDIQTTFVKNGAVKTDSFEGGDNEQE